MIILFGDQDTNHIQHLDQIYIDILLMLGSGSGIVKWASGENINSTLSLVKGGGADKKTM